MREGHRLTRLCAELLDDWQQGRLPERRVSYDDASMIARGLHLELDERIEARARHAAEIGATIACKKGCAHCCAGLVMVFKGEAVAIAQWLAEDENRDAREHFLAAYPRWREHIGDAPERARAALMMGQEKRYMEASVDAWRERVMCAFNRDGACTIYPVRPNTCRNCHALSTDERCQADSPEPPETLHFVPIEEFRTNTRALSEAVHVALGGQPGIVTPLCQEVHDLLEDQPEVARTRRVQASHKVGRNDPCPCGSGAKFKHCCGR